MKPHNMKQFDITEKPTITRGMVTRILNYFKPYKGLLLLSALAILISTGISLAPPLLLQRIVDIALPTKNFMLLATYIGASLLAAIVLNLLQVGQATVNMNLSKNITYNMKNEMYKHLQHMSLKFFSTEKQGEINTRMSSDIDGVQSVFNSTFVSMLTNVFTLATTLFALFSMNAKLALLALVTIPLYIIPTQKVGKVRWQLTKKRQAKLSELNDHTQETLSISGSTLMKVFTKEKQEYQAFERLNEESTTLQKQEEIAGRWYRMSMNLLTTLGPLLVYLFGGYLFIQGEISIGIILTFATLLDRLYRPVMQLLNLHMDTLRSFALFQRIFEYFDTPHEIDDTSEKELVLTNSDVTFNKVNFSYGKGEAALADISFTAPKGKITALVGSSGAGKTTITNLIPRLYDVTSGEILIGGEDIRKVSLESLRREIGIVTQEPYLFNGTIAENILYCTDRDVSKEELESAAISAYIHEFILELPKGYDTIVGNRGIKLSGGQKQRISIARVLLKNPSILILDEATSALDSLSEDYVQKAMAPLMENRTSIVIAHRLSTIQNADQILVLEHGKIIESGTHRQLLRHRGSYYNLYTKQLENTRILQAG